MSPGHPKAEGQRCAFLICKEPQKSCAQGPRNSVCPRSGPDRHAGRAARFRGDGRALWETASARPPGSPARLMLQEDHFCALLRNKLPSSHGSVAHEQPRVGSD